MYQSWAGNRLVPSVYREPAGASVLGELFLVGGKPSQRFQVEQEASQLKPKGAKSTSARGGSAGTEAMRFGGATGESA